MADYFDFFFKSKCSQMAAEICRLIGSPRLKVLYDIYHMQINEGCICDTIQIMENSLVIFTLQMHRDVMSREQEKLIIRHN